MKNKYNEILDIISAGDLVDKMLVNEIKIEKIKNKDINILKEENKKIIQILSNIQEFNEDICIVFDKLKKILMRQWNLLDIVTNGSNEYTCRADAAMKAQNLNKDRVFLKNKINKIYSTSIEIKSY